ncbi:hypothetical protein KRR26_13040 [Corallococcus sp. M34]|uniref:hypothetical protein n=1 Tax=Citreicoccus inhibens TaxID=2849499 RepID=UPI001C23AF5B|nr:hypothetical protein [Citreicoccus inhibens]MBU8896540.1 hypothetical protein [Citreicoccus inhibens]
MNADDLLTQSPTAEAVAAHTRQLPEPDPKAQQALREALESSTRTPVAAEWPTLLQEARGKMDSRHAEPATSHRPGVGPVLVAVKRAFRFTFQPFINEMLRRQVEFNESILDALATVIENQREHARTQAQWRRDVEARLARLEPGPKGRGATKR